MGRWPILAPISPFPSPASPGPVGRCRASPWDWSIWHWPPRAAIRVSSASISTGIARRCAPPRWSAPSCFSTPPSTEARHDRKDVMVESRSPQEGLQPLDSLIVDVLTDNVSDDYVTKTMFAVSEFANVILGGATVLSGE